MALHSLTFSKQLLLWWYVSCGAPGVVVCKRCSAVRLYQVNLLISSKSDMGDELVTELSRFMSALHTHAYILVPCMGL